MVQIDLPAAFTVGQALALLAKNYLKKEPDKFTHKLLGPLNFYLSCGFAVIGLYLLVGWPYWEVMSTTAWVESPSNRPFVAGFYILFMFLIVFLGNVGFILAHHWYLKKKDKFVVYGLIAGGILTVLPLLLRWGVWWKVGRMLKQVRFLFSVK
ncbi:MAG: hypothetical protein GY797_19420 [Deltaproteobacteria bacterium]|nr:hypothetical protein [Deltaproteobacteria bacterium]